MSVDASQLDCLAPASWRARPRSFVALMSLYESNYLRLRALVGDPTTLQGVQRSSVPGDCDLQVALVERSAHTSDLRLTYLLAPDAAAADGADRVPDVLLRVYHDARLCEFLPPAPEPGTERGRSARRERLERELGQRWARNVMLNKWLDYCMERGHRSGNGATWRRDQSLETQSAGGRASGATPRRG